MQAIIMSSKSTSDTRPIEKDLRERHATAVQRLDAIKADFRRGRSTDADDQAQERENEETLTAIEAETESELRQIERALRHLEHGSYGRCEQCAEPIEAARLNALPHATKCSSCAQGETHAH